LGFFIASSIYKAPLLTDIFYSGSLTQNPPALCARPNHAFAASIQHVCVNHRCLALDFVPAGISQTENTSENLLSRLRKSGYNRYWKYILQKSDFQEKLVSEGTFLKKSKNLSSRLTPFTE
jgi:hypothetical protein